MADLFRAEEKVYKAIKDEGTLIEKLSSSCKLRKFDHNTEIVNESFNPMLEVYSSDIDGLYIIRNALSIEAQQKWAKKAVEEFSRAQHTNLTNLSKLKREQFEEECKKNNIPIVEKPIEEKQDGVWADSTLENDDFKSFKKLRWANLGYHYDWTHRCYKESEKSPFPIDLAQLSSDLAELVFQRIKAEGAIVNYYPLNTFMSGHLDDAEYTMDEPIVSISIGRSAVFLIGGETKDIKPIAILVNSGDVVIMAGESRKCFHGIPCIIPYNNEKKEGHSLLDLLIKANEGGEKKESDPLLSYLKTARLNINVRRVAPLHPSDWDEIKKGGSMAMHVNTKV